MFRVRKVDNSFGIWDNYSCEFINAEFLGIGEKEIKSYLSKHPFPVSNLYSEKEMISDVYNSSGSLIIPGTEEQAEFVAKMIYTLIS